VKKGERRYLEEKGGNIITAHDMERERGEGKINEKKGDMVWL